MLTIQLVPHHELKGLDRDSKIDKLLKIVKQDKITLVEGKLTPQEEAFLIQKTMEEINKDFKGIEVCSMNYNTNGKKTFGESFREKMAGMLTGNRTGMTIIGPANIIKQIKRNPKKIELLTNIKK